MNGQKRRMKGSKRFAFDEHDFAFKSIVSDRMDENPGMKKIFQIGFNRCGTKTLFSFFQKNGVRSVHWDKGNLAKCFSRRKNNNEDPFCDYQDVVFFSDMMFLSNNEIIEPYREFEYIHAHYPDSYFILNTRRIADWLRSRRNLGDFAHRYQNALDLANMDAVTRHWRLDWYEHHYGVLKYFDARPGQLLNFDIDVDGPHKLIEFLGKDFELDPNAYGHENRSNPAVLWSMSARMTNQTQT
jgi:hypothetical protein